MPKTITKKITSYAVKSDKEVAVIVQPKQERDEMLQGFTYKIKPTGYECAVYITINNLNNKPFEIFVQCKNTDSFQYIQTITRLISAIWRNGGNTDYVYEELKQIFDPKGGYFLPKGGGFVNGVIHHIGMVIEKHIKMELPSP